MEIYTPEVAAARTGAALPGVCSPWMSLSVAAASGANHVRTQNSVLAAGTPDARSDAVAATCCVPPAEHPASAVQAAVGCADTQRSIPGTGQLHRPIDDAMQCHIQVQIGTDLDDDAHQLCHLIARGHQVGQPLPDVPIVGPHRCS